MKAKTSEKGMIKAREADVARATAIQRCEASTLGVRNAEHVLRSRLQRPQEVPLGCP